MQTRAWTSWPMLRTPRLCRTGISAGNVVSNVDEQTAQSVSVGNSAVQAAQLKLLGPASRDVGLLHGWESYIQARNPMACPLRRGNHTSRPSPGWAASPSPAPLKIATIKRWASIIIETACHRAEAMPSGAASYHHAIHVPTRGMGRFPASRKSLARYIKQNKATSSFLLLTPHQALSYSRSNYKLFGPGVYLARQPRSGLLNAEP